jgi:hypothetical protein
MADTTTTNRSLKDLPEKPENPQGTFEGFTENISSEGKIYYSAAVDANGKILAQPAEEAEEEEKQGSTLEGSYGPKIPCYWAYGTSGETEAEIQEKTGITWYSLDFIGGWTYKLTIKSDKAGSFRFNSQADSYKLGVDITVNTHWVFMTTFDPNITSVQVWG